MTKKKFLATLLAGCLALMLAACGGTPTESSNPSQNEQPVQLEEFTAPSGTFAVSLPEIDGGWTMSDGGNEYHLVLDNSDQSFSVMIQALPMEQAAATFSSLDEIIAFYQQSTLSEYGEPTSSEVVIGDPAIEGVVSDFYEVTQNNMTADLLISYFQTENAYYVCILTGTKAAYDANVDAVKNALTSFTEKA